MEIPCSLWSHRRRLKFLSSNTEHRGTEFLCRKLRSILVNADHLYTRIEKQCDHVREHVCTRWSCATPISMDARRTDTTMIQMWGSGLSRRLNSVTRSQARLVSTLFPLAFAWHWQRGRMVTQKIQKWNTCRWMATVVAWFKSTHPFFQCWPRCNDLRNCSPICDIDAVGQRSQYLRHDAAARTRSILCTRQLTCVHVCFRGFVCFTVLPLLLFCWAFLRKLDRAIVREGLFCIHRQ